MLWYNLYKCQNSAIHKYIYIILIKSKEFITHLLTSWYSPIGVRYCIINLCCTFTVRGWTAGDPMIRCSRCTQLLLLQSLTENINRISFHTCRYLLLISPILFKVKRNVVCIKGNDLIQIYKYDLVTGNTFKVD